MALINCPECGKQISDKAASCPNCGYPIADQPITTRAMTGDALIKIPNTERFASGWVGLFCSKKAMITSGGRMIWEGHHGETARLKIEKPTKIEIDLGGMVNNIFGEVEPGKRYELVQDQGVHMLATFRLSEVDVIDSGR